MTIVADGDWQFSEKGKKDAERHRQKVDAVIRGQVKDIIGEESIITKGKNGKVKVPIKGLKDYRFVYGRNDEGSGGVGQGEGKPGDVIGRRKVKSDGGSDEPGDQMGEDYMETEIDIEQIIQLMFEDLGLPYIEEKTSDKSMLVPTGWKFETTSKIGIQPRLHKKKTLKETMLRTSLFIKEIMEDTGCTETEASQALVQSFGDLEEAILIIKNNILDRSIDPEQLYIEDDDLRFRVPEEQMTPLSNCVIIAMIDTSGSMDSNKKYLVRSLLFWINEFLKKSYDNVVIRFITHTTEAQFVSEDEFFKKGESGGTNCHTAFDLANYALDTEYPEEAWNRYVIYASDGEDFNFDRTMKSTKEMLNKSVNMLAYCEVNDVEDDEDDDNSFSPVYGAGWSPNTLLKEYIKTFKFAMTTENGTNFYKDDANHFVMCEIRNKSHIYSAIKHILFERKA